MRRHLPHAGRTPFAARDRRYARGITTGTFLVDLALNASLVLSLVVVFALLRQRFEARHLLADVLSGLAFGIIASLSLFSGVELADGLVFDGRAAVLILAAIFAGPRAAAIALALTVATRIGIGGSGTLLGVAHATTAAVAGSVLCVWADRRRLRWTFFRLLAAGVILTGISIAWVFLALPADRAWLVAVATISFFAPVMAISGILLDRTATFLRVQDELAESLDAKNAFIASVSHELRTPLTELYGFAEELAREPQAFDEAERRELLQRIAASGATAHDVLDDLTAVSQLSMEGIRVHLEEVDLLDVIGQVTSFHPEWQFPISAPEEPVVVIADEQRARQIIRNLITNAIRHGGPDRSICVTVDGDRVETCVCDNGDGLTDELGASPFELYATTGTSTGSVPALGVGLWLSQNLARLMGTEIRYRHDHGTTHFSFEFERAQTPTG